MYSYRIEQAIKAVTVLHKNQVRKGEFPLPYSSHLFSVAFILSDYTDSEAVIVTALLHDTLEDTDYSKEELVEDFGADVAALVEALTEPKKEKWEDRKRIYEKQVEKAGEDALLVACADKIHNMRSTIEEYYDDHVRFMHDFGKKRNERLQHYQKLSNIFNRDLSNAIVAEFNHILTEYKNFLIHVEQAHEQNKM